MAKLLVIDDDAEEFRKSLDVALDGHTVLYALDAEAGSAGWIRRRGWWRCARFAGGGPACPC